MSSARSRSGGHADREYVEPEEQVGAELPLARRFLQVPVGGRHHARVRPQRLAAAHALELALLEDAQQGDLDRRRQLADLVEEDRAPGGQLEAAPPPFQRAGEGALLVPEQLRRDEPLGQRGAVDLHHGALRARRPGVDRAGEELLSRARLAGDQHGRVGRRHACDPLQHLAQPRGGPDDPARRRRRGDLLPQRDVLVLELRSELLDLLEGERVRDRGGDRPGHVLEDRDLVGRERRRFVRATTMAATNSSPIVSGSRTAHSAPALFMPAPSSARVGADVVEDQRPAVALHGVAHEGGMRPSCPPWHRLLPRTGARRRPGSRPGAAERCGSRSREPGRASRSWVTTPIRSIGTSPRARRPRRPARSTGRACEFAACATARSAWYFASPDHGPSFTDAPTISPVRTRPMMRSSSGTAPVSIAPVHCTRPRSCGVTASPFASPWLTPVRRLRRPARRSIVGDHAEPHPPLPTPTNTAAPPESVPARFGR